MSEATRTVTVASGSGLHARPASLFVQNVTASGHQVTIAKGDKSANAGSILGLLGLGVENGDEVTLTVTGDDADATADALVTFLQTDHDAA
ncbi:MULTISPECIES: HPr family phosphocarrier protein [unclassified Curtobacterium]|uniref:HPr family phosphocarrier protein n=1 Tax=unclassified Curtobacterium TaxID=257496 RepID=UPI000DA9B8EC|nr:MULTISPECIES: HPr family phosphocarrier protein [unclassified Curtobacterium]PZE26461.1 HPr family phosphocarrier protein [Curtobacterium sp. MCBD17_028]PZE75119.1 HPr family phosphocarrier protein [Curtobacterium sp. MCBD17_019]PZF58552.1 HPr family phosphocarrier protein [Curtobacterium sp. MCBD17_034]PZF64398.1 HPr family phosphocarrier protein [Curtobacterium sp. MCBD17_013]PZM34541.1 HPr family phosphocarrier protein [Curtobacterium sp. MCBD17_031]